MTASRVEPDAEAPALLWLRDDMRLADNPALTAAVASRRPVAALYVLDDDNAGSWAMGGAARWWLHGSLTAFSKAWRAQGGGSLILQRGRAQDVVPAVARALGAAAVFWNRRYEPWATAVDTAVKTTLKDEGRAVESLAGRLLFEPWAITTGAGDPYRVFTPFWRACQAQGLPRDPEPAPARIPGWTGDAVASDIVDDWALRPTQPDWAGGLRDAWTPGEDAARERLDAFLADKLAAYGEARDIPAQPGTSRLSPHLHWGEISPRQVVHATLAAADAQGQEAAAAKFLSEIGWRDFSASLLFYNQDFPDQNLQTKFDAFPWREDEADLRAWEQGRTGYPIVDAGMRELYATGWMHNRVRMIVGSFLVKHVLIDWRAGERWFWDTLVDADLANNAAGWQWIAGCGADAAPYFRIFNPVAQGERYDAEGRYVRRWIPELADLPDRVIHKPWEAVDSVLAAAGVALGEDYPRPIVEHKAARERALAAFQSLKAAA